ncbi:MAG: hypothetical protein V1792_18335, partial [Pseudomonadota bacterium]
STVAHFPLAGISGAGKDKIRARRPGLRRTETKPVVHRGTGVPARHLQGLSLCDRIYATQH